MSAVISIFVALTWLRTLWERMVSSQARETKFVFGNNLCFVGRRSVKKYATAPQRMVFFDAIQGSCTRADLGQVPVDDAIELSEAKTFAPVFVRVTDCALSSFFGFLVETFILSSASVLSFNQSLKSKTHFFILNSKAFSGVF